MGLDIAGAHSFRAGSYGGFHSWRDWLAQQDGSSSYDSWCIEHPCSRWFQSKGYGLAEDRNPLGVLMWHSDCDGIIPPSRAKALGKRLREIKAGLAPLKIDPNPHDVTDEEWDRSRLDEWITACDNAIAQDMDIIFC